MKAAGASPFFVAADKPVTLSDTHRRHFAALDSLRGLAALSVVLFHVHWANPVSGLTFVQNSNLMVDLFFVLSGFTIFYAYHGRLETGAQVRRFMWLRLLRVYPLHFVTLMVFLLYEVAKLAMAHRHGVAMPHEAFSTNSPKNFVLNLFLLQALHTTNALNFNVPSWSISTEFYTYLIFAGLAFLLRRRIMLLWAAVLIVAATILARIWLGPGYEYTTDFGLLRCLAGFFAGVMTYAAYESLHPRALGRESGKLCGRLAVAAMLALAAFLTFKPAGSSDMLVVPIAAALILLTAMAPEQSATRFLHSRLLRWLGAISYSIYMVHFFVLTMILVALRVALHRYSRDAALDTIPLPPGVGLGLVALTLLVVLTLAHLAYHWIEMPCRDWSRRHYKVG